MKDKIDFKKVDKREALKIAGKYIKAVSGSYKIHSAMMFGSFARGTNNPDSDIDIAIVITNLDDVIQAQSDLMKLRRAIDLRIEPHPFREADFVNADPLVNEINKYGIKLEAAA